MRTTLLTLGSLVFLVLISVRSVTKEVPSTSPGILAYEPTRLEWLVISGEWIKFDPMHQSDREVLIASGLYWSDGDTAYRFGFRRGELVNMKVEQVDVVSGTIRLWRGTTKNGEPRLVKMTNEVKLLLTACVQEQAALGLCV